MFDEIGEPKLETKKIENDLHIIEEELERLNTEFKETCQKAAEASEARKDQLKSEAATIKKQYEQKQAKYEEILKNHSVVLTLKITKECLEAMDCSSLQDLNPTERTEFYEEVEPQIITEIRKIVPDKMLGQELLDEIKKIILATLAGLIGDVEPLAGLVDETASRQYGLIDDPFPPNVVPNEEIESPDVFSFDDNPSPEEDSPDENWISHHVTSGRIENGCWTNTAWLRRIKYSLSSGVLRPVRKWSSVFS